MLSSISQQTKHTVSDRGTLILVELLLLYRYKTAWSNELSYNKNGIPLPLNLDPFHVLSFYVVAVYCNVVLVMKWHHTPEGEKIPKFINQTLKRP